VSLLLEVLTGTEWGTDGTGTGCAAEAGAEAGELPQVLTGTEWGTEGTGTGCAAEAGAEAGEFLQALTGTAGEQGRKGQAAQQAQTQVSVLHCCLWGVVLQQWVVRGVFMQSVLMSMAAAMPRLSVVTALPALENPWHWLLRAGHRLSSRVNV
jgi:hypothetical protein